MALSDSSGLRVASMESCGPSDRPCSGAEPGRSYGDPVFAIGCREASATSRAWRLLQEHEFSKCTESLSSLLLLLATPAPLTMNGDGSIWLLGYQRAAPGRQETLDGSPFIGFISQDLVFSGAF